MPHCVIEYSADLAQTPEFAPALLRGVHQAVCDSALFDLPSVKSRLQACEWFCSGEDAAATPFVHVTVKLLQGRSAEQKSCWRPASSAICPALSCRQA